MSAAEANYIAEGSQDGAGNRFFLISALFERTAFYGLVAVILLSAVPNGTVEVWQKAAVVSGIAVVGLIRVVAGAAKARLRIAEPVLLAPMLGVMLLAVVQCIQWPASGTTISRDPYETRAFIYVFGSLIVCGEMLLAYTDNLFRLKMLTAVVIAVAVGSSLFGFLWEILDASDCNFLAYYVRPHQGYAQFINRNHFAVLVEMALGLLIGLLLKAELNERQRFFGWVLTGGLIYSLIAANSRGGLVSLAGLAVFAVFLHIFTKRPDRSERFGGFYSNRKLSLSTGLRKFSAALGICVLVVGLIVFMIAVVGGDRLVSRFEKVEAEVTTLENTRTNRNLIWASTIDLIAANPVLGVGFGAYEVGITNYDRSNGKASLKQAHNEYLEILANSGIAGALLFAGFAVLLFLRIKRNLATGPMRAACAFGSAAGIFAVLVHSLVDFGLHVMVNALLFVVMIVIAAADLNGSQDPSRRSLLSVGK